MLFKDKGQAKSVLSPFDLVGEDEVSLAKIFAFILSKDKEILSDFLKLCHVRTVITEKVYINSSIVSEVKYKEEGRTDIEIDLAGKEHIILETKVKDNKANEDQLDRYQSINKNHRVILITSKKEYSRYKNITWDEIVAFLSKKHNRKYLFQEFYHFYQYRYYRRNKNMQEILTQDVAWNTEVKRYTEGCIYKGHATPAYPLYFAPYFTRKSGETEGISSIAKVLFIMKTSLEELNKEIKNTTFYDELKKYAQDTFDSRRIDKLVKNWIQGITIPCPNPKEECTFYFLDFPQKLPHTLLKEKGGGKGWISLMIPINRMISFDQILYQMEKQKH